jgi:hypothetical protein
MIADDSILFAEQYINEINEFKKKLLENKNNENEDKIIINNNNIKNMANARK